MTSERSKYFAVGKPFFMVLIWNLIGVFPSSLVLKNTSHLVTNTPVASLTSNDCANGS